MRTANRHPGRWPGLKKRGPLGRHRRHRRGTAGTAGTATGLTSQGRRRYGRDHHRPQARRAEIPQPRPSAWVAEHPIIPCGLKGRANRRTRMPRPYRPFRARYENRQSLPRPLAWAEETRPVGPPHTTSQGVHRYGRNRDRPHIAGPPPLRPGPPPASRRRATAATAGTATGLTSQGRRRRSGPPPASGPKGRYPSAQAIGLGNRTSRNSVRPEGPR